MTETELPPIERMPPPKWAGKGPGCWLNCGAVDRILELTKQQQMNWQRRREVMATFLAVNTLVSEFQSRSFRVNDRRIAGEACMDKAPTVRGLKWLAKHGFIRREIDKNVPKGVWNIKTTMLGGVRL